MVLFWTTLLSIYESAKTSHNLRRQIAEQAQFEITITSWNRNFFFSHYQTAKYTGILRQPPPFAVRLVTSKVTKILKGISLRDKVCLQNSEGTWQSQATLGQLNSKQYNTKGKKHNCNGIKTISWYLRSQNHSGK